MQIPSEERISGSVVETQLLRDTWPIQLAHGRFSVWRIFFSSFCLYFILHTICPNDRLPPPPAPQHHITALSRYFRFTFL